MSDGISENRRVLNNCFDYVFNSPQSVQYSLADDNLRRKHLVSITFVKITSKSSIYLYSLIYW